jgi:hypothetical protein
MLKTYACSVQLDSHNPTVQERVHTNPGTRAGPNQEGLSPVLRTREQNQSNNRRIKVNRNVKTSTRTRFRHAY